MTGGVSRHGMHATPTYYAWQGMKKRCTNKSFRQYADYGGRGISVCARWINSFENFLSDMGVMPHGMTLERINNNLGYSPDNCRWASRREQNNNRRNTRRYQAFGEIKSAANWAQDRRCVVDYATLTDRISKHGWDAERALTTPVGNVVSAFGQTKNCAAWAQDSRCAVGYKTLMKRIRDGWIAEIAIGAPAILKSVRKRTAK